MSSTHAISVRRQGLTILTTEACNFACIYCHQPHDPILMRPEVADAIIRFVERKAKAIDCLDISWFGGEPLANQRILLKLSEGFVRICHQNDILLHGFMSTNGYLLTRELLADLIGLGISRYQITFDGPQEVHDSYRVSKSGKGTFSQIWQNVCSFRDLDDTFEILIRVHVTPPTISAVKSFLATLCNEFSSDSRFKIVVANVSHWGGPNDARIPVFRDPTPTLSELRDMISLTNRCTSENIYCNAADPTHMVIRPSGMIVKCAHSLDLEENRIGHLSLDGRFVYEPGKIDFWIRGIFDGDLSALQCPRNGIGRVDPDSALVHIGLPS
jgi:uncharacterized protein